MAGKYCGIFLECLKYEYILAIMETILEFGFLICRENTRGIKTNSIIKEARSPKYMKTSPPIFFFIIIITVYF